jgi:hypothetical protein
MSVSPCFYGHLEVGPKLSDPSFRRRRRWLRLHGMGRQVPRGLGVWAAQLPEREPAKGSGR